MAEKQRPRGIKYSTYLLDFKVKTRNKRLKAAKNQELAVCFLKTAIKIKIAKNKRIKNGIAAKNKSRG